jgi:hypothetical protein
MVVGSVLHELPLTEMLLSSVNLEAKQWVTRDHISCRLTNVSFSERILTVAINRSPHMPAVCRITDHRFIM